MLKKTGEIHYVDPLSGAPVHIIDYKVTVKTEDGKEQHFYVGAQRAY